ncbi:condensation domain-containing protein [Saccharothrix syringae]|uniref:Condensation domain-containing protein n=1 Tax=Saccharothrix syringae TaxID=103733 RepID=A0A5Q0GXU7_SACSY|nr:condensation domain-containing protein [Saccharothrix syringae]QFZ18896.1 hypothetical protein EKG83_16845 [Saccharothrix syringae]
MSAVAVSVSGCRAGTARLTWGQASILRILTMLGPGASAENLSVRCDLKARLDVPSARAFIGRLLGTYDVLRTRYEERGGEWYQVVDPSGSVEVRVVDQADADEALQAMGATDFALADEWPVRFALVVADDEVTAIAFACSHIVSDAYGLETFAAVLGDPGADLDPGVQPLDQAAYESSPRGLAVDARAREYWHRQLTAMPPTLFPGPPHPAQDGDRFWYAAFTSQRVTAALPVLASRHRTTSAVVLYAAFGAVLAERAGTDRCPLGVVARNRNRPGTRGALGSFAQLVPITLDVAAGSWDELFQAAAKANLQSMRHGAYDPRTRFAVTREVELARGTPLDLTLWFNDTRGAREAAPVLDPAAPLPAGEAAWVRRTPHGDSTVFVYAYDDPAGTGLWTMFDTTRIPLADAEALLGAVEEKLVRAALA